MSNKDKDKLGFTKLNYLLLLFATILIIVAYFIMSLSDITVSPLLLSFAYVVLIPFALLYKPKDKQ